MPIESEATHRADLSAVLWEYAIDQIEDKFVGLNLLSPFVDVPNKESGYYKIEPKEYLRTPNDEVGRTGGYNRVDFGLTDTDFSMQEHGLEHVVKDKDIARYGEVGIDAEELANRVLMNLWLLNREKQVIDHVEGGDWSDYEVATVWSSSSADPLGDIQYYKDAIEDSTGVEPNALVVSADAFRDLRGVTAIQDFLEATVPAMGEASITPEMMRQYFDVEYFAVSKARYVSTPEGESVSMSPMLSDKYAFLARVSEEPQNFEEPCAMKTFTWTADAPDNPVVEQYRAEEERGTVYRVRNELQVTTIMSDAARRIDTETAGTRGTTV